jgi:hypothetical protein
MEAPVDVHCPFRLRNSLQTLPVLQWGLPSCQAVAVSGRPRKRLLLVLWVARRSTETEACLQRRRRRRFLACPKFPPNAGEADLGATGLSRSNPRKARGDIGLVGEGGKRTTQLQSDGRYAGPRLRATAGQEAYHIPGAVGRHRIAKTAVRVIASLAIRRETQARSTAIC